LNGQEQNVKQGFKLITAMPLTLVVIGMALSGWLLTLMGLSLSTNHWAMLLGVGAAVGVAASTVVYKNVIKPTTEISNAIYAFNEGNMGVTVDLKRGYFKKMGEGFNSLTQEVRHMVGELQVSSEQLKQISSQLAEGTDETASANKEMATTMDQISQDAQGQASAANSTLDNIEKLLLASEKISNIAQETGSSNLEVKDALTESVKALKELVAGVREAADWSARSAQGAKQLEQGAQEIHRILEVVTGIAAETNLLALNAAIEAARAGEHGRGFAIVAERVRELSEESVHAVDQIKTVLGNIQTSVTEVSELTAQTGKQAQSEVERAGNVQNGMEKVVNAMVVASEKVGGVENQANIQVELAQQVQEAATGMTSLAEGTAAAVEEAAASVEEQLALSESINETGKKLLALAQHLHGYVDKLGMSGAIDDTAIGQAKDQVSRAAVAAQLRSLDSENIKDFYGQFKQDLPECSGFVMVDASGKSIFNSNTNTNVHDFSFRDWFKDGIQKKPYISNKFISALTGKLTVSVAYPVLGEKGRVLGVLCCGIEVN